MVIFSTGRLTEGHKLKNPLQKVCPSLFFPVKGVFSLFFLQKEIFPSFSLQNAHTSLFSPLNGVFFPNHPADLKGNFGKMFRCTVQGRVNKCKIYLLIYYRCKLSRNGQTLINIRKYSENY